MYIDSKPDNAVKPPINLFVDIPRLAARAAFTVVTEQDFHEFTFANAAPLHTRNKPNFFKGAVVEQAVADELGLAMSLPDTSG